MLTTIKPAQPDLIVLDPNTGRALPAEGSDVAWSGYWDRRQADGDIVIIEAAAASTRQSTKKKEG